MQGAIIVQHLVGAACRFGLSITRACVFATCKAMARRVADTLTAGDGERHERRGAAQLGASGGMDEAAVPC